MIKLVNSTCSTIYWVVTSRGFRYLLCFQLIISILTINAVNANSLPNLDCNRECLITVTDTFLEGLVRHEPSVVPWADRVRFTENNVELAIGDGIWGTITGIDSYRLHVTDEQQGQAAFYGVLHEPNFSSLFSVRLKVEHGLISEVEMVVLRTIYEPKSIVWPEPKLTHKSHFYAKLPLESRRPRERMISIADGYFDTLQLNDGTLFTKFHPDCNRVENGTQTTHNSSVDFTAVGALGCEEQFKQGNYRYDSALRERSFPLVDVERGLVLATGFIDHNGQLDEYSLADGRVVKSPIRFPHSFYLMELFKIVDGQILQIEAVFVTVPYGMHTPWEIQR
jgi:hypothetical protein